MKTAAVVVSMCAFISFATFGCQEQPSSLLDGDGGDSSSGNANGGSNEGGNGSGNGAAPADGGGGAEPIPQTADFLISADAAASIELRDSADVTVSIDPNGYVGAVALTLANVPGDVDASLDLPSITLDGTTPETVTVTVASASNSETGAFAISVVGTVSEGTASGDMSVTIEPVITIIIPQNLADFAGEMNAFGPYPTVIKAPPNLSDESTLTVKFFNDDTVPHEIHADADDAGFGHGDGPIAPGSFDAVVRQINQTGEFGYYPHDIGTNIPGLIVVE